MPDVSFTELPGRRVLVRRFGPEDADIDVRDRVLA